MATKDYQIIDRLVIRLKKLGIDVMFSMNYPWIYLETVNGMRVKEKRFSNHGFTVATHGTDGLNFLDLKLMFQLIRQYSQLDK